MPLKINPDVKLALGGVFYLYLNVSLSVLYIMFRFMFGETIHSSKEMDVYNLKIFLSA